MKIFDIRKGMILFSILIAGLVLGGCAVSDYITGAEPEEQSYSLIPDEEESGDNTEEIDEVMKEIEAELGSAEDAEESATEESATEETEDTGLSEETAEEAEETAEEAEETAEEAEETAEEEEKAEAPVEITVKEGDKVNLKPKAKDADGDDIKYTFSEPLNSKGRWETDYGDAGDYIIIVTASDGNLETSKKVLLTVERVNVAPEITGVSSEMSVEEGDILSLSPKVSDPNGDDVELTISEPVGDDGEWEIGYQDAGEYTIKLTATDGEKTTVKEVALTVKKKNVAPVIEGLEETIEAEEGDTISLSPKITDLNGDDVELTISDPVGDDGVWETGYNDHGTYSVIVTADDGQATTTKEISIVVKDVNVAPVIEDITQE